MKAPTCRWCGRKLRAYRETIIDEAGKAEARVPADALNVRAVTMPYRRPDVPPEVMITWQPPGRWGRYGDALFCGIDCGYRWAVAYLGQS